MGWTYDGTIDTWPPQTRNINPYQQEIEFFWPLTEQIELDLDYTRTKEYDHQKYKLSLAAQAGQVLTIGNGSTSAIWVTANEMTVPKLSTQGLETPEITFTLNKKPFIIKRLMYKLLGFKWKVK